MAARWTAWLVWAAAAASLVFWGLRLGVQGPSVPDRARWVDTQQAARGDVLRLFARPAASAAEAAVLPASSRMRLLGVVAPAGSSGAGWAVISLDGKPARAVRVGAAVEGDTVVLGVSRRRVEIGPRGGAATAVLELQDLPVAARGVPGATAASASGGPVPPIGTPGSPTGMPVIPGAVQAGAPVLGMGSAMPVTPSAPPAVPPSDAAVVDPTR